MKNKDYRKKEILEKLYLEDKKGIIEISKILGISQSMVIYWFRKHGIISRKVGDYNPAIEFFKDKNFLYQEYIINKKSLPTIAKEMNCSDDAVRNWLNKHSIPIRSISESLKGKKKPSYMIPIFSARAKKQFSGSNNPNWKGGVTPRNHAFRTRIDYYEWQQVVWKRDNYTCALCSSWEKPHAHHILPLSYNWEERLNIDNGITLCKKCHESIKGRELQYSLKFSLMILNKRVNSGKPLIMGNPEPSRVETRKVQRLAEKDTSFLITATNALLEREEIVHSLSKDK